MKFQFLCTDTMSSVLSLLSADDTSQTQWFSPYGVQNYSLTNTPGFNGERRDPLTGLTHLGNGYRAYNPLLMRFQTPDSMSPFGKGGINSYAYCEGDPVNRSDPTGHMSTTDTVSIIFGAVGLALGVATGVMTVYASRKVSKMTLITTEVAERRTVASQVSRGHKVSKLTKELVGPSLDILASSSGIASALENDQGNKQTAKILGVLSLTSYGLSTVAGGYEFYKLRRHPDPYAGRLSIGTAILATATVFGGIHEGAAVYGYFSEGGEQETGDREVAGITEVPDNPTNGYVAQNSNGLSSNQEAFINPQSRPGLTQMSNRNMPRWPIRDRTTKQQKDPRLLF